MEKEKILKAFYQQQIAALAEQCNDVDLLDLVYRLLKQEAQNNVQDYHN